jgi:hypothetical protein
MTLGRYQFQISANTVRRRLAEHDLRPRISARGPQLAAARRRIRLLFAQNHVDWELDQWRLVMFSDESRFCLDQSDSDRRVRVNRCSGERYAQCNIIPKVNFGRGVRFSNALVNLRIEYNACKNLRIATIFVILELHRIRIVTDCVCEILLQWRSVATMQNVQCCQHNTQKRTVVK